MYTDFNPEFSYIEIKTNSSWGSDELLHVVVKTTSGAVAGRVQIFFTSTPQYYLSYCFTSRRDFSSDLSVITDEIWTITLKKTPYGDRNVVIQYNIVEVVDVVLSDETCDNGDWKEYWSKDIAEIGFSIADTASDFFRTGKLS